MTRLVRSPCARFDRRYRSSSSGCIGIVDGERAVRSWQSPFESGPSFTAIIGGSKVKDKIDVIDNLLTLADNVIIGGGLAYTFFKAQGHEIGQSLLDKEKLDVALGFIEKAKELGKNFYLPEDIVVTDEFSADANTKVVDIDGIPADWEGVDIGPKTRAKYAEVIKNPSLSCGTVLWAYLKSLRSATVLVKWHKLVRIRKLTRLSAAATRSLYRREIRSCRQDESHLDRRRCIS